MAPTKAVKIKLDKVRMLRFTNRAQGRCEDETGKTLAEHMQRWQVVSIKSIAAAIWTGLLHETPNLTVDQVLDMVDTHKLAEYEKAVVEAFELAFLVPKEEPGTEKKEEAPAS